MPANNYSSNLSNFLNSLEHLLRVTTDINEIYEHLLEKDIINQSRLDELLSHYTANSSDSSLRPSGTNETPNTEEPPTNPYAEGAHDEESYFTDWT